MSYKDKFKAYLDGSLGEDKAREVEEDIEKIKVISGYLDEELDEKLFDEDDRLEENVEITNKEEELKDLVQKAINKKLRRYGILVGSSVLAIVLFIMFGLSPIMDRIYYNPSEKLGSYSQAIDLPLAVYTELHCANRWFNYTNISSEGYGKYSLKVGYQFQGEIEDFYVTMDRGKFVGDFNGMLKDNLFGNSFTRGTASTNFEPDDKYTLDELRKLPDTAIVEAAISFPKDLDLKELEEIQKKYNDFYITYVPVRVVEENAQAGAYFGFEPYGVGVVFDEDTYDNEKFPLLELANKKERDVNTEQWEIHFKSMLKYMAEAEEFNTAINSYFDYKAALDYVEESGIKTFGVVVKMPVKDLLQLRDDGVVENILVTDAKLSIFSK